MLDVFSVNMSHNGQMKIGQMNKKTKIFHQKVTILMNFVVLECEILRFTLFLAFLIFLEISFFLEIEKVKVERKSKTPKIA